MSVRTAQARQRVPDPEPDHATKYATEATPVLRELLHLSQKLSRRSTSRYSLELRIRTLIRQHAYIFDETPHSRRLVEYIDDVQQHKGWLLDFESLGEVPVSDLRAGLACHITHNAQSWRVAGLYQRSLHRSNPPLNFGAAIVGGVVLARFLKVDPQLKLIWPALEHYHKSGCDDFYAMVDSLESHLAALFTY